MSDAWADVSPRPLFSIDVLEATAGAPVVQVHGDVDLVSSPALAHEMTRVAERCPQRLVLDLTDVGVFDARGVAVLVSIRRLLPDHCRIVLRRPRPLVRRVLEVTEMERVCIIEDQIEDQEGQEVQQE